MGLIDAYPDVARTGIRLRKFGQDVIRLLGGKSIHPAWTVPGGVREPLSDKTRQEIEVMLPGAFDGVDLAFRLLQDVLPSMSQEIASYGDFPSYFLGLVTPKGGLEHYDGVLRVMDSDGRIVEDGVAPEDYRTIIGEAVEPWSYLKFPYYKKAVSPDGATAYRQGMYRVGPLARVNIASFADTPKANAELAAFRTLNPNGKPVTSSFHYHYARLIEILFGLEKIAELVADPAITDNHVRSRAEVNQRVGVGVSEAPRGTLFHEYHVDDNGILQKVNLIIATGQNNLAMNRTVRQIADNYIQNGHLSEGILNRIEHGIRTFDPCLSCSTHAVGQMPLHVQLLSSDGQILDEAIK
jgi:NAD-reducing hydrogenase large subunit